MYNIWCQKECSRITKMPFFVKTLIISEQTWTVGFSWIWIWISIEHNFIRHLSNVPWDIRKHIDFQEIRVKNEVIFALKKSANKTYSFERYFVFKSSSQSQNTLIWLNAFGEEEFISPIVRLNCRPCTFHLAMCGRCTQGAYDLTRLEPYYASLLVFFGWSG